MNKFLASLGALAVLGSVASAQADSEITVSATVGFESEYVFRGVQIAPGSLQASVEVGYAGFYAGVWTNQPLLDDVFGTYDNEVDLYVGYSFAVAEGIELDVGGTLYIYPETPGADETKEIYVGASFDTVLSPSLYAYYDFDVESFTVEASVGHTIDLSDVAPGTSLKIGGTLGWVDTDGAGDYFYLGGTVDLSYAFTDSASISIGGRVTKNDIDRTAIANRENVWWGVSFTAGF